MADPFRRNAKSQLLREAQIGLSVVAVLLVILVYVAFYRITGRGRQIPEHVRNAPVAQTVWPNAIPPHVAAQTVAKNGAQERTPGDISVPETKRVGSPKVIENQQVTSKSSPQTNLLPVPESKSVPTRPIREDRLLANSNAFKMVQTKTSDPLKVLNHPDLTQATASNQGRKDPSLESVKSTPKQSPQKANEFQFTDTRPVVTSTPNTAKKLDNRNRSNSVAPVGFDNELRATNPRLHKQQSSTFIGPAKNPINEFPTQPVRAASAKISDPKNSPTKPFAHPKINAAPSRSPASDFNSNDFKPTRSHTAIVTKNQESKPVPSKKTSTSLRSHSSDADAAPIVSVLDGAVESPKTNSINDEKLVDERHNHSPMNQLQPSDEPILIAPKPFLIGKEFESAKPLPTANKHVEPDGKTETVSSGQIPQPFSGESAPHSRTYIVQNGDSFWSIAEKVYGDGRFFRALYKHNQPTIPGFDSLLPGTSLGTPTRADLCNLYPDDCPFTESDDVERGAESDPVTRLYVTREGDTLFEIARQKLGQASRYLEIKKMNRFRLDSQVNHLTRLRQGVRLVLPVQ